MRQLINRLRVAFPLLMIVTIWTAPCQGFEFQGFGAVNALVRANSANPDPNNGSFEIGQLDFFVAQTLGERLDLLSELVVEGDPSGEFAVDLERFQIGYLLSNLLTIRAGRFHTPLGYWNATFHHGFHLQTSISRPDIINFEDDGGILPVHLIGMMASGYQKLGSIIAEYDVAVGNGSNVTGSTLTPNSVTDNDARKAFAYRVAFRPTLLPEGELGISGYFDRIEINDGAAPPVLIDEVSQMILGVDLSYTHSPVEVIGEYYYVRDKQRLASSPLQGEFKNSLFFVQAGYTLFQGLTPYVRYEQMDVHEIEDPYFVALGTIDTKKTIGGLRFDLSRESAIKFEGRYIDPENQDDYLEYAAQWTIAF